LKENFDRFNSQIYKEKEMADFRKCIFAFAVVALLLGLIPAANAQNVSGVQCIANSGVPPTLRSEGLTELTGDIVLTCSGGTPTPTGFQIPQANITIFLNTQVTSRLLATPSANSSEAVLTIDEPPAANTSTLQTCTSITGCADFAAGPVFGPVTSPGNNNSEFRLPFGVTAQNLPGAAICAAPGTSGCIAITNHNVFQGVVSGNSVTFVGIPIDPPGTTSNRIYRITNVRANATIPAPGGSGTPGQIIALISATPATNPNGQTSTFAINNPTQIVGFVQQSLTTAVTGFNTTTLAPTGSGLINIRQCLGQAISGTSTGLVGYLQFNEVFPTAFKTRTVAGTGVTTQDTLGLVYNSESGYVNPRLSPALGTGSAATLVNGEAGLADYGTRLKAVFNNVPNGVSIWVSVSNREFSSAVTPVTGTNAVLTSGGELGSFTPVTAVSTGLGNGGIFQVPLTNGSGTVVWEVTSANPLASQSYNFSIFAAATASPQTNSPAVGIGTVNLSYAPTPPSFTAAAGAVASSTLGIPRFIDTSTATQVIQVTLCKTNLLFPFVTNQIGLDTGIAISNTSTDPFGTAAQQGTCFLNFYGQNAPAQFTTPNVASGTTFANTLSNMAPAFQGYIIAQCNFQYAHGMAFISDVGIRNVAMGYLALIIPDPPRAATAFECVGTTGITCSAAGEQLGY
jgi:hypothetical protein